MTSNKDEPRFAPALRGYDRQQVDDYVARLRRYAEPRFAPALRGYDRQQVDDYVARLRRYADDAYNLTAAEAEVARRGHGGRDESRTIMPAPGPLNQPVPTASNELDALGDSLSKILLAALKEAGTLRAAAREEAQRITEEARLRGHDEGSPPEAEQIGDESVEMIRPAPIPLSQPVPTAIRELDALRDSLPKILLAALKEAGTLRAAAREEAQRITEEARLRGHDEGARTEATQIVAAAQAEVEQMLARGREQAQQQASQLLEQVEQARARLAVLQAQVAELDRRRDEARAHVRRLRALLPVDDTDTTTPPASRTDKLDVSGRAGAGHGHTTAPVGSFDRVRQAMSVGLVDAGRGDL